MWLVRETAKRPEGQSVIAFDPVPSRCLGGSLGINNIPEKTYTYSCI